MKKKKPNLYKMCNKLKNSSNIHDILKGEGEPEKSRSPSVHKNISTYNIISGKSGNPDDELEIRSSKRIMNKGTFYNPITHTHSR